MSKEIIVAREKGVSPINSVKSGSGRIGVGETVKFREVLDKGDEKARFTVLEDRGDRVLIQYNTDLPLKPTQVVKKKDIIKA